MPETHKIIYKEKTGEDWPHKGWWGRPESLDMNIFDFKAIPEVKSAYTIERQRPNTMVISLTGRRPKLSNEVEAILNANGYVFDKYLYNYGKDTLSNKIEQIDFFRYLAVYYYGGVYLDLDILLEFSLDELYDSHKFPIVNLPNYQAYLQTLRSEHQDPTHGGKSNKKRKLVQYKKRKLSKKQTKKSQKRRR